VTVVLRKIISGGQTGVDQVGLVIAKRFQLETGGWAPKGWRTQAGPNPELGTVYGLKEHSSTSFAPRTHANVRDADATVWFGERSPGYVCTLRGTEIHQKPFFVNYSPKRLKAALELHQVTVLNVAGNRLEMHPEASELAGEVLEAVFLEMGFQPLDNTSST
jgi:hypothetical protein